MDHKSPTNDPIKYMTNIMKKNNIQTCKIFQDFDRLFNSIRFNSSMIRKYWSEMFDLALLDECLSRIVNQEIGYHARLITLLKDLSDAIQNEFDRIAWINKNLEATLISSFSSMNSDTNEGKEELLVEIIKILRLVRKFPKFSDVFYENSIDVRYLSKRKRKRVISKLKNEVKS